MRRRTILRAALIGASSAGSLAGAGCGAGADRVEVRTTAMTFAAASVHGDGATECAQLSPQLREQLIADQQRPTCAQAVGQLILRAGAVTGVRVDATSARADLTSGEVLFLGDTRLGWRIEAVGCKPHGVGPYDCQAQA